MNGYKISSYSQTPQPGQPTYTEAWALVEAARRMAVALEVSSKDNDLKSRNALREALQTNWRLWTIFQAELTLENSDVPNDIRTNMLTLCKFVDTQSVEAMQDPAPEKIATLIDINRNIASGMLTAIDNEQNAASEGVTAADTQTPPAPQPPKTPAAPLSSGARADDNEEEAPPSPLSLDI